MAAIESRSGNPASWQSEFRKFDPPNSGISGPSSTVAKGRTFPMPRSVVFFLNTRQPSRVPRCPKIGRIGLQKETPGGRTRSLASGTVFSRVRLGGLHHRYDRAA